MINEENFFSTKTIKRAKIDAIIGQCLGIILPATVFQSSVFVLYAVKLGADKTTIMFLMSVMSFLGIIQVFTSFWVDLHARKKFMSYTLAMGAAFVFLAVFVPFF